MQNTSENQQNLLIYRSTLLHIQNQIIFYTCITNVPIGIVSNLLNVAVCMRKKIRKEAMGFYSPLMSLFNILSLTTGTLQIFPATMGQKDLLLSSDYHCMLLMYFCRVSIHMSSWLNIMLSLDRTISITYPHRFTWHKDRAMLVKIVIGLLLVISVLNVPNLIFSVVVVKMPISQNLTLLTRMCSCKYLYVAVISDFVSQLIRTALPIVIEFALNIVLIYKLVKSRSNLSFQRSLYRDYKFSFTIVMLNLMFFITQTPLLISLIYLNSLNYYAAFYSADLFLAYFLNVLATLFASSMFVSLFFVNLAFNKRFTNEFFTGLEEMVCFLKRHLNAILLTKIQNDEEIFQRACWLTAKRKRVSSVPVLVGFKCVSAWSETTRESNV